MTTDAATPSFVAHTPFVLASPEETLVARGVARTLRGERHTLAREVASLMAEREDDGDAPILVGALPFDSTRPAHLFVPRTIVLTRGASTWTTGPARPAPARGSVRVAPRPSRSQYERAVSEALARMTNGSSRSALQKVVLARSLFIDSAAPFDLTAILARLRADHNVTAFSVPLPGDGDGWQALVGATPELLLKREGRAVTSTPLAGSAPRSTDVALDRAAADQLLCSDKDQREHALVVDWIADRLTPYCVTLTVPRKPELLSTSAMWHLATHIRGELRDRSMSSVALAAALHPTPAVCGMPAEAARETIRDLEPFDRGFFAGAVGWCAANGDGQWLVAIRCARISATTAELYAGAGIVPGSIPSAEADETSAKFATLLRALAVDEQGMPLVQEAS